MMSTRTRQDATDAVAEPEHEEWVMQEWEAVWGSQPMTRRAARTLPATPRARNTPSSAVALHKRKPTKNWSSTGKNTATTGLWVASEGNVPGIGRGSRGRQYLGFDIWGGQQ